MQEAIERLGNAPDASGDVQVDTTNPGLTRQESLERSVSESTEKNQVTLNINDPNNRVSVDEQNTDSGLDIRIDPSFSFAPVLAER